MATKPGLGSVPSGLAQAGADASSLSLGVDTSGVEAAKPALDAFTANTEAAARAADKLTTSTVQQSKALSETRGLASVVKPIEAGYTESVNKAKAATDSFGTSSARARTEIIVLLHELSQDRIRQFAGSLLVMAEFAAAGQIALSGMNIALGALAIPLALAGYGFVKGAIDSERFRNSLILTNNAAGITGDTLQELTAKISQNTGATAGKVRDVIEALVASGRIGPQLIEPLASSIVRVQKLSGEDLPKVIATFEKLAESPTRFALENDKAFNAINLKLFENIRFLEEHGQKSEAARIAAQALSDHFNNQTAPALGYVSKLLKFAADDFSHLHEVILSFGRDTTFEDKLKQVARDIANIRDASRNAANPQGNPAEGTFSAARLALLERQRIDLLYYEAGQKRTAAYKAESAAVQLAAKETSGFLHELDESTKGADRKASMLEKLAQAEKNELKARRDQGEIDPQIDPALHAKRVAEIERRNIPSRIRGAVTEEDLVKINIDKINQQFKTIAESYREVGQILAAQNAAGLTDTEQYLNQRGALVQAEAALEIEALRRKNVELEAFNSKHRGSITDSKAVADNTKLITRNEEEMQRVRDKTQTQLTVLGIQTKSYLDVLRAGYLAATLQAEELLRVTSLQHDRQVAAVGLSSRQIENKSGLDAIDERERSALAELEIQRRRLEEAGKFNAKEKENYEFQLNLTKSFHASAVLEWERYYKRLTAAQDNWKNGANRALQEYIDNAGFTARNTEQVFNKAFSSMEDALTSFVTTGKLDFKTLVTSIIGDLTRLSIQQQLLKPLAQWFQGLSFLGGGGGAAGAANGSWDILPSAAGAIGGSFGRNSVTEVVERGPELLTVNGRTMLMMGDNTGKVTPSANSGPSTVINFHIESGISRNEFAAMVPVLTEHIKAQIAVTQRRPGYGG